MKQLLPRPLVSSACNEQDVKSGRNVAASLCKADRAGLGLFLVLLNSPTPEDSMTDLILEKAAL